MKCKICDKESSPIFSAKILKKYEILYFYCENCGFLQTEEPYWIKEAYVKSINNSDTGYLQRNLKLSQKLTILLSLFFDKNGIFCDYAGGYGIFVRLMRDVGFDFYWDDKFTQNIFAIGFEYQKNTKCEAITTFESFEHFVRPIDEIENMLKLSKNIIFSTEILPDPIPAPKDWWYYGLSHGQHVSFYSLKTLNYIASKFDLFHGHIGSLHIFTEKRISNVKLKVVKLNILWLHKILQKKLKSKTWEDYLKMSLKNESVI